ncbi:cytochrome P450 [Brucella intermedia]|uniref:cytochrome P450 n=1 Tax=Brucella intermedia TaxID=94625 RepID=UPI00124C014E|nr:cytochrome P450 [Brucella intermedia]KAB2719961.1 cytochrome P450 [Brucella intermedia]
MSLSSQICGYLYELARERNGENITTEFNGVNVLIVQRLEDADHILRLNANNYRKNMAWFRQALGASRFSEDGYAWEIRRQLTQSYFNRFDRENTFRISTDYAEKAIQELVVHSQNEASIDESALRRMTASVLIDNFFGIKLDDTGIDLAVLAELMAIGSDYSFVPEGKTSTLYRDRLGGLPALRREILRQLGYFRSSDVPRAPLLEGLLEADRRGKDRVVLEHELMTFMAAGAETSAATMGWACYLLALYPEVQEALRAAARAFWHGDHTDWQTLSKLKPLSRFISEALRLYPPTPIVARYAIDTDKLGTTHVSPGQNIMVSFIGVQLDRRFRADPWALDMDDLSAKKVTGETMAFSIGPRICGGKQFALLELMTFLSVFLNCARFELTSNKPPSYFWKSQMLRDGGQPVRVVELN